VKGVILAGGNGIRLRPATLVTNKHLLPVYDKPMIYYPINTLKMSGITDITIVCGSEHAGDFIKVLGSGKELGVNITYITQDDALGIAHALYQTENLLRGENIAVILGDNIFEGDFEKEVNLFERSEHGCYLFVKESKTPERFGVLYNGEIIEKPEEPLSNRVVTGFYIYNHEIFTHIEYVNSKNGYSKRGELEITDVNNLFLKLHRSYVISVRGFWSDAGTFDTLLECANWAKTHKNEKISMESTDK